MDTPPATAILQEMESALAWHFAEAEKSMLKPGTVAQ